MELAKAYITLAEKGFNEVSNAIRKVQEQMRQMKADADTLGQRYASMSQGLERMTTLATRAFVGATAAIGGFLRLTDPRGVDNMTVALASVSIQLGRFFVPLLREATGYVQSLASWLKSLTDVQREQVLHWTKITLAILAALTILPRLFSLISSGVTILKGLHAGLLLIAAANPLTWILTAIAAFTAFKAGLSGLWSVLSGVGTAIQWVITAIQAMLPYLMATATFFGTLYVSAVVIPGLMNMISASYIAAGRAAGIKAAAIGGLKVAVEGLKASLASLMAHPVALAFAVITTAVMAMSGAFSSVADQVKDARAEIQKLEGELNRLRQGGAVRRQEVGQLDSGLQRRLHEARTPEDRKRILNEEIARTRQELQQFQGSDPEGRAIALRQRLEGLENRNWVRGQVVPRANALREAGVDPRQFAQMGFLSNDLRGASIGRDMIDRLVNAIHLPGQQLETRLATLTRLREQGGVAANANDHRGEMRPQAVQLLQVQEAWRRVQQSQVEDPQTRIAREQLAESRQMNQQLGNIDRNTRNNNPGANP